jgi:hypothetical protein
MITSMLDMFTIVLVFLLNFLDPSNESDSEVVLPQAAVDAKVAGGTVLTVSKNRVLVDGEEVFSLSDGRLPVGLARTGRDIDALHERLAAAASKSSSGRDNTEGSSGNAALAVHCDRTVPFFVLGELLYTAGQAGYGQFRFVVITDPG